MHYEFNVKKLRDIVISLLMFSFVVIVVHILLQSGISCTDSRGCLRSWCKFEYLNTEYQTLVKNQEKFCN